MIALQDPHNQWNLIDYNGRLHRFLRHLPMPSSINEEKSSLICWLKPWRWRKKWLASAILNQLRVPKADVGRLKWLYQLQSRKYNLYSFWNQLNHIGQGTFPPVFYSFYHISSITLYKYMVCMVWTWLTKITLQTQNTLSVVNSFTIVGNGRVRRAHTSHRF